MKKRLISFLFAFCAVLICLSISVFASEEKPWEDVNSYYGDSKVSESTGSDHKSHTSLDNCDYCNGYDTGYYDGAHAGYESGYYSSEIKYNGYYSPEEKDQAVAEETANILDEFLQSEEFEALLQSAKDGAVQAYKDNEGQAAIDAAFDEGHVSGYNSGYDAGAATVNYVYKKGYADGQANFRSSEYYINEIVEYFKNGFNLGYDDAYIEGYNEGVKYQINPGQIVSLVLVLLFIAVLFVVFSVVMYKTKKKRKGKKR